MVRSFRLFVSRYVNIGAGRGFFNMVKMNIEHSTLNIQRRIKNNEFDWMDKGIWLLRGFIIGAAMVGFMSFVMA
jgi:hypothetical protein